MVGNMAKVSFRSAKSQASHAVRRMAAHGTPRHNSNGNNGEKGKAGSGNGNPAQLHSIGTERAYGQALTGLAEWLEESKRGDLRGLDVNTAKAYLEDRAAEVGQKTLDLDRQAINALLGITLPTIASERETILQSRAYTPAQISMVAAAQTTKHALATEIAAAAGLRAHELLTLRPATERPADAHREYRPDRFTGREGALYTVTGKGGLCREILLPHALAARLESKRWAEPQTVYDRQIQYRQHYDIGGGKHWSDSFSKAADRALGWSTGAHGVRHTYAQERVLELQRQHYSLNDAKLVVSQELGHFRADIIDTYLR